MNQDLLSIFDSLVSSPTEDLNELTKKTQYLNNNEGQTKQNPYKLKNIFEIRRKLNLLHSEYCRRFRMESSLDGYDGIQVYNLKNKLVKSCYNNQVVSCTNDDTSR